MSENAKRILLIILLVFVIIIALPLLFPLFIGGTIASLFQKARTRERYEAFLKSCNGLFFFCYTNQNTESVFIERYILPNLDPDLNVILLIDREPECEFDKRSVTTMLTQTKSNGFPKLIHIKDSGIRDISLQDALKTIMDAKSDPATFVKILREQRTLLSQASSAKETG